MKKKTYGVVLSAYATIMVEASSEHEAEQIALNNFEEGKEALICSINQNGYEANEDPDITEEYSEEV